MNFSLTEEQRLMKESFARFFDRHSTMAHVRATAENGGFDSNFWLQLAGMGFFHLRVPENRGGLGLGIMDALVVLEEAGRTLASGPLVESLVALRLLSLLGGGDLLEEALAGERVVTIAFHDRAVQPRQWVAGATVATHVLARDGNTVLLLEAPPGTRQSNAPNLASSAIAEVDLGNWAGEALSAAGEALPLFQQCLEEWKLLMAGMLHGLSRQALLLAAEYACERQAFEKPIGAYQAISHPLADLIVEVDAAKLFSWKALYDIARNSEEAGYEISIAIWWSAESAARSVRQALHTFGGYGLATEYDIHLYNLRAKSWPLLFGDPDNFLDEAGIRLYDKVEVQLPDVGHVPIDFDLGEEADNLALELDAFFLRELTPEMKAKAHYSFDGFDAGMHRKLAENRFLFPAWPEEFGGRNAPPYVMSALYKVWEKHNWTTQPSGTTNLVGSMIRLCGNDFLKSQVLSRIVNGESICSLGYSEPGCGSDVFAARTRAVRNADGSWTINGAKMWTSGANIADYVLLLTRTNESVAKHQGLTMFVVPLDCPGIAIHAVHTFQEERTNATFYDNVRIGDEYRLGPVDGGLKVMSAALTLEHSFGYMKDQEVLLEAAEQLCSEIRSGDRALIDSGKARRRLARTRAHIYMAEVLCNRALWSANVGMPDSAFGPMTKLFSSEKFLGDANDLLDLTAPHSLSYVKGTAAARLNLSYRHAHGTTIYAGTSEIHRSMIAEKALGLPRSRT